MDTWVCSAYDTECKALCEARIREMLSIVLCSFQNARLPAAADEPPDRRRFRRRHPAADALCIARPQAGDNLGAAAGDLRIVAARKLFALSAGIALSAVGGRKRRGAGWHHHSRRIDRG